MVDRGKRGMSGASTSRTAPYRALAPEESHHFWRASSSFHNRYYQQLYVHDANQCTLVAKWLSSRSITLSIYNSSKIILQGQHKDEDEGSAAYDIRQ
jgi:hypothetical protein